MKVTADGPQAAGVPHPDFRGTSSCLGSHYAKQGVPQN